MVSIFTCPHCGRSESWRPGDAPRTHCRFCQRALAAPAAGATPPGVSASAPSSLLGTVLTGGVCGGAIAGGITLLYMALPLALAYLLAQQAPPGEGASLVASELTMRVAIYVLVTFAGGFGMGLGVIGLSAWLLQGRPRSFHASWVGAIVGALCGPAAVAVTCTLPLFIQPHAAPPAATAFAYFWQWIFALAASAAGAALGPFLLLGWQRYHFGPEVRHRAAPR